MQDWERYNSERARVEQDLRYLSAAERANYNLPDDVDEHTPKEELAKRKSALKRIKDATASSVESAKIKLKRYNDARLQLLDDLNELPPADRSAFNVPDEAQAGITDDELAQRQRRVDELAPAIRSQAHAALQDRVQRAVDRGTLEAPRAEGTPATTPATTPSAAEAAKKGWPTSVIVGLAAAVLILIVGGVFIANAMKEKGKDDSKTATAATAGDSGAKAEGSKEEPKSEDKPSEAPDGADTAAITSDAAKPETPPAPAAPDDAKPPETVAKADDPVAAPGLPQITVSYNKETDEKLRLIRERAEANRNLTP